MLDDRRQMAIERKHLETDPQHLAPAAAILHRILLEPFDPRDDLLRALTEEHARAGQAHRPRVAIDQSHAKFVLQVADLAAERGLRDVHFLRGAGEVHRPAQGEEIAELSVFHIRPYLKGRVPKGNRLGR